MKPATWPDWASFGVQVSNSGISSLDDQRGEQDAGEKRADDEANSTDAAACTVTG